MWLAPAQVFFSPLAQVLFPSGGGRGGVARPGAGPLFPPGAGPLFPPGAGPVSGRGGPGGCGSPWRWLAHPRQVLPQCYRFGETQRKACQAKLPGTLFCPCRPKPLFQNKRIVLKPTPKRVCAGGVSQTLYRRGFTREAKKNPTACGLVQGGGESPGETWLLYHPGQSFGRSFGRAEKNPTAWGRSHGGVPLGEPLYLTHSWPA